MTDNKTTEQAPTQSTNPKRMQMAAVIGSDCSVARVRSACRNQLNSTIDAIKADITSNSTNNKVSWKKLPKSTCDYLLKSAKMARVEDKAIKKMPKDELIKLIGKVRAFKLSKYANVATTAAVNYTVHEIVKHAMTTAKSEGKNNILNTHIVNDSLKNSSVYALIYNLDAIDSHANLLKEEEEERKRKEEERVAARLAAREERRLKREAEKKAAAAAKKAATKKQSRKRKTTKGDEATTASKEGEAKVESEATVTDEKKDQGTSNQKAEGEQSKQAEAVDKKDATSEGEEKKPVVPGSEYLYYIDKIISVEKGSLGEEYKGMRSSAYFRHFCSMVVLQLITRMTNMYKQLIELNNMKTITDNIVKISLRVILADKNVECQELLDGVDKSVKLYREYMNTRQSADK